MDLNDWRFLDRQAPAMCFRKLTQLINRRLKNVYSGTIFFLKKNSSLEDILTKRPNAIEVNLDFELEKLLKEIHYLQMSPLSIDLSDVLKDKFNQLKDENKLRLYVTRIRSIANNYNIIMKNLQQEETALFEMKLNKIDSVSVFFC